MQRNYFFCFQQSVCHTPVYLHLGYRFLLGQIQISNKAGGREMKEISVSCWGNLPLTVLCAVGIMSGLCSDVLSQLAAKSWGCRGTGEKQVGWFVLPWSLFPLPGKLGRDRWIGWAVSSLVIEKKHGANSILSYVQENLVVLLPWMGFIYNMFSLCWGCVDFAFRSAQPSWGHTNGRGEEVCLYLQLLICSKSIAVT